MNIGLNDEARLEVGRILNLLMADETVLYATVRDYQWNVPRIGFYSLHMQFEAQFQEFTDWIDQVAERARAIGVDARGNGPALRQATLISASPGIDLPPERMIIELLDRHKEIIVQLRTDSATCAQRFGDAGTADFLTGLREQHEKTAWMLRAQLETEEALAS